MESNVSLARSKHTTAAGITNYFCDWRILDQTYLVAYLNGTQLYIGQDYTISGVGNAAGFTISLVNDPGNGKSLVVLRNVTLDQQSDYQVRGDVPSDQIERDFDKVIEVAQQDWERFKRSIRFSPWSDDSDVYIDDYVADKWLKFHPTQRRITLADPPSGAPGLQGPAGPGILFGSGAPSGSLGSINATYIDTSSWDVYSKTAVATWTLEGNIKGGQGDPGADGVSTTHGAAGLRLSVDNGDFAEGDLTITVDLTTFALADANYQLIPAFSWPTGYAASVDSETQATIEVTAEAPAGGIIYLVLVAQGDLNSGSGTSTLGAHDHTSRSGDGGVLTKDEHDSWSQYNQIAAPATNPPLGTVWIYADTATGRWMEKWPDGTTRALGYFTHTHATATDGGILTTPKVDNYIDLKSLAAPGVPASGYVRLYQDSSDSHYKVKDASGNIVDLQAAASGVSFGSYGVRGLVGANNSGTPNTQFDITADQFILRNSSNQVVVIHNVGTKTLNIATAGAGGRDQSGAFAASNWLYVYGIYNGVVATVVASLTAPPTGPTLPTGYTHWGFLTAIRLNSSGNLVACKVRGSWVIYNAPINVLTGGPNLTETAISLATVVPPNGALAKIRFNPSAAKLRLVSGTDYIDVAALTDLPNVSQQVYYIVTIAGGTADVWGLGYSVPNGA